ncbi:MAG: hypothetical protein KAI70_00580 [Candidatus Omnitrophica bacterium]|nr:hypothetical protein [Candidatus Omnitrophota bacterium]
MDRINRIVLENRGLLFVKFKSISIASHPKHRRIQHRDGKNGRYCTDIRHEITTNVLQRDIQASVMDFERIESGTFVLTFDSGCRVVYSNVFTKEISDTTINDDGELTKTIVFVAESKPVSTKGVK